jgi:C-terminal processing protease CtpA/Prc
MLHDLTVHNMVVGGPVYMSGNIEIGDTIIKVDGKGVSLDDYEEAFVGCDVPGSKVQLTVRKKKGGEVDISIVRIARSEMAGRVQLFEQFTTLTDLASQSGDSQLMAAVEDTINSSTKLMAESDSRDTKAVHNILQLQLQCSTTLLQLKAGLKELRASFDSTVEEYTNEIMQLQKRLKAQEALVSKLQAELQGNPVHDLAEEKSSPNKSFHVNRPKYSESMGLGDLLETCREVCENLERTISTNVLAVTTAQHQQQDFHTTSTVGIMLQDLTIDNLVVGGPAYRCKQLDKGDVILRVDGVEVVLETIQQQITGTDLPGSEVTLTVMKGEGALQGEVLDVTIRKMARVEMADHVKMFELFTTIKEVAMVDNPDGAEKVDECISLWTRMLLADAAHAGTVAANVRSMQTCGIQQTRAIQEGLDEMKGLKRKTEEERRQALMRRVAKRMLNQTMAAALERWTVNACELARQRCIMDRILKRMLRGKMSAAYQQWCSNAAEKKVMGAKVGKVVGRWMNRCVGQAIEAWHEYSMEEARRRNVMTRAARRLEKRGVVLALELWKANVIEALEDCAEEERRDAILGKVVKRMLHATLASGLLRWQEQVWELRRHRKLLSIQVHDLMERSVGRLLHRTLWFAMDLWQQNVSGARQGRAEEERRNAVMQRVVKRMMHAALAASFLRWRDNVRELRWQQGVMERVARRMKNAGMFAAFQRWRENITEKEAMEATSTRVVLRWKLQAVARCLERWRELTAEEGQKRDLMGRIVARMLLRSLLFAMDRWQQNMLAVKQERAEEERRQALMRRVAKRMLNQTMAAALERWTVNACELARQRCIMDRILKRMLRGKMSAAYQQWCSNAAEKKVMGAKVGKVVGRWMNRCVGQAIEAWHEYSMEEARRRNVMTRAARRLEKRGVVLALELWKANVIEALEDCAEEERRDAILGKVVKRMLHATLASGLLRWQEQVWELRRHRKLLSIQVHDLMERSVGRLLHRTLWFAMDLWQQNVSGARQGRAEEERRNAVMQRVVKRMMHAALAASFLRWRDNVRELRWQQGVMERVARRMKNAGMFAAFQRWRENITEKEAMEATSTRVVLRWKLQAVARCLERWRELTAEEGQKRDLMGRIVARMLLRSLLFAMDRWQQNMLAVKQERAEEERRQALMRRVAKRMLNQTMAAALERWTVNACELARQRCIMDRILKRMLRGKMSAAYQQWCSNAAEKKVMGAKVGKVVGRWMNRCVGQAIEAWHEYSMEEARRRNVMTRAARRLEKRGVVLALELWKANVIEALEDCAEEERRDAILGKVVKRMLHATLASGLLRWQEQVWELRRHRKLLSIQVHDLMERSVGRLLHRTLWFAMDLWQQNVSGARQGRAEEERRNAVMQRVVKRMMHAALAASFLRWRDNVRELRWQQGVMERVARRMKNAGMFAAFQRWRENITEKEAMEATSTRVVLRWKLQAVARCLERWRELTAEEGQKRDLMGRIVARMLLRSLLFAMDRWQQNMLAVKQERAEEERRQALMRRVAKRMLNQTMAAALERWTVNACELARQRCIMDRILKRMLRGKMSAAYQQWCSNAAEKKVMGAKVGKVVGRWMNRCVGQAIEAWHEYSVEEARRRNVMTRAARRLEKRGVVLALELWKANVIEALEDCAEEERRDAILGKVVKRMLHATLASGLLRWQEQVWELRRHRKLLSIQVHDLMERSVGRLLHRTLWFAMDLWQQNVSGARQGRAEEERRNAVMQRVVKRMMHAALAASFLRWRDNVRELRWQQGVMERVARRMKNAGMFAAFQRWRENITEKEAMEATSTRVVLRWKLQAVARCLERWRELTAEEGQKRDLMGRIVARMLLRSLLFAMDRWQQNMLAVKQERAEEERRQALMRRVAKRMLNQTMAAALERWTVNACELARQRCIMDRILKRMLRGKMSAAYQQWCSNAAEKKVMGAKVGKVVGRWMNRCVGQAIEAWHEYSMEEARRRNVMTRAARRLEKRGVVLALELWKANVIEALEDCAEEERRDAILGKVVKRMLHATLASGLLRWQEQVWELRRHRKLLSIQVHDLMERSVGRLLHRTLWFAMDLWQQNVSGARQGRAEEERRNAVMQRVVKRMMHAALAASFLRWRDNVRELRWQQGVMERVARRMKNAGMFAAFQRWRENITEKEAMEATSTRVVLRWKLQAVARCLERWRELTAEEGQKRDLMGRIVARMLLRSLLFAMDRWQQNMLAVKQERAEEERRQALMRRVAKRMLNQTMAAALERWTVNACELARQRCIMDRILKRMLRGKMSAAYQQWCSNAAEKKVMGAKVGKVVGRWMNRCVGQAIEAWHEYSMEEARRRNVMTRAARRLEKRGVVLALELWKANVIEALEDCAEEERRDAILGKVVKRMLHATLASGLLRWQEQVWELRRHRKLLSIQVHDLMERSVGRLLHRTLWFAMDLWQQNVSGARQGRAEEERRNAVMQRVVKRMMHAALAASFLRWRDNVRELRWQQGVMERVARRMKNAGMFAAFQRWRENITEKEAMEATSTRVVLRWKLQAVARCLERWRELTAEEGQKRDLMGRIVARMLLRSLLFAMDRWQQNMLAVKQERAEEERRQALMRRVAKRMLNQTMAAALERWTVNACELARQRCIMDRILKRMLRGKMSAAYQQWCSNAAEKKVMGAKVGKVVGRWMNRCVGQAIEAWHEYSMEEARRRWEHRNEQFSQELHEMNVKLLESKDQELCSIKGSLARLEGKFDEQNESFQNRLADTKFNHILVQWKYKAITFCLDTWRRNIYVMRRLQRNIEKVMNRLRAKLFHEWLSRRIFSNRTRRTSRKIMQERHRTLLIIAYKKWKVFGQREAKLCRVTERFLRKMRKLKSFHTLMMWSSRVDYEKCHRLASQKAISFWVASVKTTVCARWSQLVSRKKSLRRASTACARINLILWGINKSFMLSFNAWALTCAESGRLKKAGSIIFNRSTRLGLSCSVQTWRDATKKERGLCKLISRSASESVAVCFKRWRAKVFEKKSVRHLRERTTRKVWRILLMRALSRWMDMLKLDHELKSENAFCELQFSRNQLLNAEDDLRKQIESLQLLLDSEQRTFINHAALVVQSLQSLDKQVSDMQYIIEIVRQQIEQQKHAQMKAEHDITELQKRNLDIESVCEAQTAALMTVEQERSKALAVKDAEIEHLKCVHGHISAEKQDEVERMKLAQEESTQAIVKIEKKRSQRASAPVSKVPAPEWKEKLRRSLVLSERLRKRVRDDVLAVETAVVTSNEFIQKTTVSALHCITANCCAYSLNFAYLQVGIMFSGTGQVESVMIGSPAYLSGKVQKGDFIVEVDGKSVSGSTVLSAIIGEDIPGSYLTLTLKRDGNMVYVNLKRIPTADVADKRRMFDLFTLLKDRAKKDQDWNAVKYVEETLLLWEKMTSADQIHDDQIVENVKSMQTDCTYCSDEISALLLEIWRQQNWGDAPDVRAVDDPIELCSFSPMPTPRLAVLALFRVQTIPTRGDEQGRFKDDLRKELAEASGHPVGIFLIHEMQGGHVEVEILQDPTGTGPDASQILENLVRQSKDPMSTLRTGRICCHLEVVCHRPSGTSAALDHSQVIFP